MPKERREDYQNMEELKQQIAQMNKTQNEMHISIATLVSESKSNHKHWRECYDRLEEDSKKHSAFIDGNGIKGAKTRLDILETSSGQLEKHMDLDNGRFAGMFGLLLSILGLGIWGTFFK